METYIKVYDWMAEFPAEERLVYALIYQLTKYGNGFWSTTKVMADRLGIKKSVCKNALLHLEQIGAIECVRQNLQRKNRRIFLANEHFARQLQDE